MSPKLYKFLKSKGDRFEFCYKDKEPFLVSGSIDTDLMEEYARNDVNECGHEFNLFIGHGKVACSKCKKHYEEIECYG